MKKLLLLLVLVNCILCWTTVFAGDQQQIPDRVTMGHWSCKQIADLSKKYDLEKKLPGTELSEGKSISKAELAEHFLLVMDKLIKKCEKEGKESVEKEDLERAAFLQEALKDELAKYEGYQTLRDAIVEILAKPEEPNFEYKLGVNGFLRGEGAGNFGLRDFSYNHGQSEGRFIYRVKPYAYWHPTDYIDIHLEGQGFGYSGKNQEFNRISLYQGFVEGRLPGSELLALKAGRQEFVYGSAFVLGSDALMDGLTFDALRLRLKPLDKLTIDLLGGWYAKPFSNGVEGNLAGGYATWNFNEGNAIEGYVLRDIGSEQRHGGEHRDTWGLRGTAKLGPVSLELEPVWQTGRIYNGIDGNENINAYGGHADLSVDASTGGFHNHFFLSYAFGSGSVEAASGGSSRKEFSTPTNDSSLFGDMKVIGGFGADAGDHHASGLHIATLGWGIDFTKELNFSATGRYFHANRAEQGFNRNIGVETDFTLTYALNDNLSVIAGYDHFFTGRFFRDATGNDSDVHYGYMMLQFDLSHVKTKIVAKR